MTTILHTFVQVRTGFSVTSSVVPTNKKDAKPSVHLLQYELLSQNPYRFTHEDLIYEVHIWHKEIPSEQIEENAAVIRAELFQKSLSCMRASMLSKKYGWGVHYDQEGKLALYGMETDEYRRFVQSGDSGPKLVFAMRNKRA